MRKFLLPAVLTTLALAACSAKGGATGSGLTTAQAAQHVGEHATVCGKVASTHYAENSEGQPTFVNLDRPYPDQLFTIVVFGDYRGKFSTPPEHWSGRVCVTGTITQYDGKPEIKVFDPSQVSR